MEELQDFAILEYRVNMRLDNLPVAEMINFAYEDKPDKTMQIYNLGYALGGKLAVCSCVDVCCFDWCAPV